ncbi:hypothetical protein F4604DRAFT_1964350 [Suillus subluteus]|nr:hypothetical protein F4604DRAFT_1964350 [Suillus subluteus]
MPAAIVVAHPDIVHDYNSFPPKASKNTDGMTPEASPFLRPNLLKSHSASRGLFLGNKTAEHQSSTNQFLPVPGEEVQENKTVELEEIPATTVVADDPLYDIQQFYHSEQLEFTPSIRRVWEYLTGPTPAKSHMEFPSVGAREFELLEHAVRETGRVPIKPRLTYDYNDHILTIDMPTILHESFYDDLKQSFTLAIHNLPYDRMTIRPQIHMNYPLQIVDKVVTPDMVISLTATQGPTTVVLIPYVGETALTEEWDHVFGKVESMIAKHPEIVLASIVLVREAKPYASPPDGKSTTASETLHNRKDSDLSHKPQPLPLEEFITQRSTPRTFEEPVRIADHTWCHVRSVEYFLWFKGEEDKPIDMRNGKPEHRAHGILMPEVHMDAVTEILQKAFGKMRNMFLKFQQSLDRNPTIPHSVLEKWDIPPFPVNWALGALGVMAAVDLTAHLRYMNWHGVRFRGTKHARDSSYAPSESEHESNSESMQAAGSKRASARKGPPSHHAFQTIMIDAVASGSISLTSDKKSGSKSKKSSSTARKSNPLKATGSRKGKGNHGRKGSNKRAKA